MSENIYQALNEVMKEVGYVQKKRGGSGINYSYAGEAALIEAIRPHLVEHGIVVYPVRIKEARQDSYKTSRDKIMNRTTVLMVYTFSHAPSSTHIHVEVTGEGADVGDKSANKALTGAYKYALRQALMIETGDDPDNFKSEPRVEANPEWTTTPTPGPEWTTPIDAHEELRKGICTIGKVASLAAVKIPHYEHETHALNTLAAGYELSEDLVARGFKWIRSQRTTQDGGVNLYDWLNEYASKKADEEVA